MRWILKYIDKTNLKEEWIQDEDCNFEEQIIISLDTCPVLPLNWLSNWDCYLNRIISKKANSL